jgi:cytosine/adenosine deaminase-related metal-dependent hydrolase
VPPGDAPAQRPADLILAGTTIIDPAGLRGNVDIHVRDGVIARVGPANAASRQAAAVIDYAGRLVVPAYTNSHHHFATGLLRLEPPGPPTRSQRERLERVIWPFERRLTPADVRLAVRSGLVEAIRAGTTIVVDHHVSGGCIPGILDVIAEEVVASGARAVLCYEVSDRDGSETAAAALAENERFLQSIGGERLGVHGMVGLHALSTVGPASLARAVDLAGRSGAGLHLHLGESEHDNDDSVARHGQRPVARLDAAGALNARTLVAHAIHLTAEERDRMAARQVMVAHCPRSNASNGVGLANLDALHGAGLLVGLGGDGFTQDMRTEVDLLPLLQRQEQRRSGALPVRTQLGIAIDGSAGIVERLTGWRTGRIEAGFEADLVGLAYEPVIPVREQTALWHYSRGFPGGIVRDVWSRGRPLLRDGQLQTLDEEEIRASLTRYGENRKQVTLS